MESSSSTRILALIRESKAHAPRHYYRNRVLRVASSYLGALAVPRNWKSEARRRRRRRSLSMHKQVYMQITLACHKPAARSHQCARRLRSADAGEIEFAALVFRKYACLSRYRRLRSIGIAREQQPSIIRYYCKCIKSRL